MRYATIVATVAIPADHDVPDETIKNHVQRVLFSSGEVGVRGLGLSLVDCGWEPDLGTVADVIGNHGIDYSDLTLIDLNPPVRYEDDDESIRAYYDKRYPQPATTVDGVSYFAPPF